ncbi:MAG: T9SS type A sorting domain-containing protein [Bacteroidetes bacterium]|nr:T9SS type A sorting domain-containing protein [Bacteroidota bacterium]
MPKRFLFLLFFSMCIVSPTRAQYTYLMDSLVGYRYSDSGWINPVPERMLHNEGDSLLVAYGFNTDSTGKVIPFSITTYHYDGVHPQWLNKSYQYWDTKKKVWVNLAYSERHFDLNGLRVESTYLWDTVQTNWKISTLDSFLYSGKGLLQSQLFYSLRSDTLHLQSRKEFKYTSLGQLDSLIEYLSSQTGLWLFRSSAYFYDQFGLDSLIYQVNFSQNATVYSMNKFMTTRNAKLDSVTWEYWTFIKWKNEWHINLKYEHCVNPKIPINTVQIMEEIQDMYHFKFAPVSTITYSNRAGVFGKQSFSQYYMHRRTSTGLNPPKPVCWTLFPNPSSGMLFIRNQFDKSPHAIQIFDVQGKCLYSDRLESGSVDIGFLPAGVYLCKMYNESGQCIGSSKVIKSGRQ